jgi:hypothetical protein
MVLTGEISMEHWWSDTDRGDEYGTLGIGTDREDE